MPDIVPDIEKVRRSKSSLSQLSYEEKSNDILYCKFKPDTTIVEVNDAYCEHFGYEKKEIMGKKFIELAAEDEQEKIKKHLDQVAKEGKEPTFYEHKSFTKNGKEKYHRWIDKPIYDKDGELKYFESIATDITKLKKAKKTDSSLKEMIGRKNNSESNIVDRINSFKTSETACVYEDFLTHNYNFHEIKDVDKKLDMINDSYKLSVKVLALWNTYDYSLRLHKVKDENFDYNVEYYGEEVIPCRNNQRTFFKITRDLYKRHKIKYKENEIIEYEKNIHINMDNKCTALVTFMDKQPNYSSDKIESLAMSKESCNCFKDKDWIKNQVKFESERQIINTYNFKA